MKIEHLLVWLVAVVVAFTVLVHVSFGTTDVVPVVVLTPAPVTGPVADAVQSPPISRGVKLFREIKDDASPFTPTVPTRLLNYTFTPSSTSNPIALYDDSSYQSYIAKATSTYKALKGHDYRHNNTLEHYMKAISEQPECDAKPVFMSMARVSSALYWQLIENFFHTMYHFGNLECVVMVCVSDPKCVSLCAANNFPCFDYSYGRPSAPTFEQVAAVKIKHVGLALSLGVNIMLLDLDVGFLRNPMILYEGFIENPDIQIICQMDIGWGQDKFKGMSWRLFPRTNFGLFIVKAHERTVQVFERGWVMYMKMPEKNKNIVAKDQSIIHGAMQTIKWRYGGGKFTGLNYSFFFPGFMVDIQPTPIVYKEVLLLHKVEGYNDHGVRFELGGNIALEEVGTAVAAHATCYEKTSKLYALKAVNAFWNSAGYYMPSKKTLTKPLMIHESREQLLDEVKALMYVALKTGRSLIIPNILVGLGLDRPGGPRSGLKPYDYNLNEKDLKHFKDRPKTYEDIATQPMDIAPKLGDNLYWPAFRTVSHKVPEVEILEPGFYYKIENHLFLTVPDPHVLQWQAGRGSLDDLVDLVASQDSPRVVLDIEDAAGSASVRQGGKPRSLERWARGAASSWGAATINTKGYQRMPFFSRKQPPLKPRDAVAFAAISRHVHLCQHFLARPIGNRSCFNKCN